MKIDVQYSQLVNIPPFESIVDQAMRQAYEQNAKHLAERFGDRIRTIVYRYVRNETIADQMTHEIMYLLTHTEVNEPPLLRESG